MTRRCHPNVAWADVADPAGPAAGAVLLPVGRVDKAAAHMALAVELQLPVLLVREVPAVLPAIGLPAVAVGLALLRNH